ncbi:MAG: PolyA polymerase family protein [Candidatus Wolfebacteria bacterium GW2011_GWA2_42_10]|uniref:PolyA polymerase family protein n=2 Tax=Candidatus Wolfeibacteriota TaxID=1752735 RepID=A0A0G1AJC1_9BACT|nr:MAG: PolyA polymerase family protein [Candidatus Wolfebacteria bacterium GW2011_GWB1_41_12]KKS25393.1 MAG: PolyA polymerase family protein [Candidatus Wolfebacteria bacterium GW2011_GWA2_42_10]KKT56832.1 MAG: PolyA polymerase family protein [Candidatus Wolfebacteria bacterium GW2011_GWA1_44_24]
MKFNVPEEIINIAGKLQNPPIGGQFQVYLVGGCVRDLLLGKEPKDWDITTNAKPEKIQKIFSDSVYENKFGTVAVKTGAEDEQLKIVEITTFRLEGKYTDKRHPDEIKFAETVEEDLGRRDFTINALALDLAGGVDGKIIDPFGGQKDLKDKIIRTVGNPEERFNEDALRLMRAVRFAVQLNFEIEEKTLEAVKKEAGLIEMIAKERICDEFQKIIITVNAKKGIELLEEVGLLKYIIPELREGIGTGQNKHHIYTVWEHNLRALDYAVKKGYSLEIRLASLLHDVGKPRTKQGEGPDSTFYNHEIVGAKMTAQILDKLHFPKNVAEKVIHLVRFHLFYYNVGEVTETGVRRFLRRVGPENVDDFIKVREADRIGSGVPKAVPYKIRHLLFMIDKVKRDPISPKMLKVNGEDVMRILNIEPGPKIGQILSILLDEVIEEPEKNTKNNLETRIENLGELSEKESEKMAKSARERKEEFEGGIEEEIKKKYYVK